MKTIHNPNYRLLIELLKKSRIDSNLTQEELAKRMRSEQTYVSKYERCERRLDILEVKKICQAMRISLTNFIHKYEIELKKKHLK